MTGEMDWLHLLRAYAAIGEGKSRHPDDVGKRTAIACVPVAIGLAADGLLHRSPATHYCTITPAGLAMVKQLERLP